MELEAGIKTKEAVFFAQKAMDLSLFCAKIKMQSAKKSRSLRNRSSTNWEKYDSVFPKLAVFCSVCCNNDDELQYSLGSLNDKNLLCQG